MSYACYKHHPDYTDWPKTITRKICGSLMESLHHSWHKISQSKSKMASFSERINVPASLHKPVIKLYHEYAHVSADKTLQLIKRQFWWPAMAEDVDSWRASCLVCAAHNQGKPGRTKLCRPNAPKGPWEALEMDFLGPLPSAKGRVPLLPRNWQILQMGWCHPYSQQLRKNSGTGLSEPNFPSVWSTSSSWIWPRQPFHRSGDERYVQHVKHQTEIPHSLQTTEFWLNE